MANSPQARKRARQNEKKNLHNRSLRSRMRTALKKVNNALEAGDAEAAKAAFPQAVKLLDSMVNKALVAKNKAARLKSRMNAKIKAAVQKAA